MTAIFTLLPDAVSTSDSDSKDAILGQVADRFAQVYNLDRDLVLTRIMERETLGSTGFGRGFALPHARIAELNRPVALVMKLDAPVEFGAADGMPIDLVFGLLSPEGAGATHLHALAAISRMMRDERMHEAIVAAPDAESLYSLLCNVIDRDVPEKTT